MCGVTERVEVPKSWGGFWWGTTGGWVGFVAAWMLGALAWQHDSVPGIVAAGVGALWILSVGVWLGTADGFVLVAIATMIAVGVSVAFDNVPLAIAVVVVAGVVTLAGFNMLRSRVELARSIAWVAVGLGALTNDRRRPEQILSPSWSRPYGLPIRMSYPDSFIPDSKRTGEMERVVSERLGTSVRIEWKQRVALIEPRPEEVSVDGPAKRLSAVLGSLIPGATVTELRSGDGGKFEGLAFTWPSSSAARVSSRAYQGRIASSLQAAIGVPISVDFDTASDRGVASPLPPLPNKVPHPPRDTENPMKVKFGVFRGGRPCVWDLDSTVPHVLIVGGTGGGKTVLLLSLVTGLPPAEIYSIDPKRVGLYNLDLVQGSRPPATNPAAIVATLLEVKKRMDERYVILEGKGSGQGPQMRQTFTPIVLVIDEGEELNDMLAEWWQSGEGKIDWQRRMNMEKPPTGTSHRVMDTLGSILRLGREARVHVILASQQVSSSWLKTSSRSQFAVRIALQNLEASTSLMTFGSTIATSGLENLPGRAWVSPGVGVRPEHAQIYWTPKLQSGLGPADRAILHGLGIALPDDPERDAIDTQDIDTQDVNIPDYGTPVARESMSAPSISDQPEQTEVSILDLEDGMRVVVEADDGAKIGTVESVEPDYSDPEYLVMTYRLDSGELCALSVADSDTIVLADQN